LLRFRNRTSLPCGFAKPDPREKQLSESRAIAASVMPELKCCDEALNEKGPSPFEPGPSSQLVAKLPVVANY